MELSAFDLHGKVALITGGAHGIGFSIAEGMARCGAEVCFNCSSQSSYEKGVAAYQAAGIDAHGYIADVTDWAAVQAMVARIKQDVGPVDILVNNAGIIQRKPMLETDTEDFRKVLDVHIVGAFNCSKGAGDYYFDTRRTGLVSTEDFVTMVNGMGIHTGVDQEKLYALGRNLEKMLGRQLHSFTSTVRSGLGA